MSDPIDNNDPSQKDRPYFVSLFTTLGKDLLDQTEKNNIITLAQFEPYVELFTRDPEKLKKLDYRSGTFDSVYADRIQKLFHAYRVNLGINLHFPTIVVDRLEEPRKELIFLDRLWTRIKSDHVVDNSARDRVPAVVSKAGELQREDIVLNASLTDVVSANATEEQTRQFQQNRAESAILLKLFAERNLNPAKRAEITGEAPDSASENTVGDLGSSSYFGFDDEE